MIYRYNTCTKICCLVRKLAIVLTYTQPYLAKFIGCDPQFIMPTYELQLNQ